MDQKNMRLKAAAKDLVQNRYKYLMILPVLVYFALFAYKPIFSIPSS
jgi:ABC-type polysaccharide transport system permease subunit